MRVSTELLVLALLVLANGLLAMAETAVVSARRGKLRKMASGGDLGATRAIALSEQPARFLALVQFWLTLSGMIAGVLGGAQLAGQIDRELLTFSWIPPHLAPALAFVIVALGLTGFMLVFGELIPKRVGLAQPEKVASALAGIMGALAWLASPFLWILDVSTGWLSRLVGLRPLTAADRVSEDEVRAMVEQGLHAGVFQRAEKEMVEGVLSLDQLKVTALMTPRPKIVFLNLDDAEDTNWRKIVASGHSYFPVYQGNRDQIVGLVAVKALWAHSAIGLPTSLRNLLVPPLLVPETMTAIQMLEQFKKTGRHIAVVVDEFGAVQGLVTLIDVFESIVGDLPQQGQARASESNKQSDGSYIVDAVLPIAELKTLLGNNLPLPHESAAEYQSAGGFVVTQLGRIPAKGDKFDWEGWTFEVLEMDRRRVDKIKLSRSEVQPNVA